jgi:hypothetical protein
MADFWETRQRVNAEHAIFHQWQQLEASGCIENFRIAAGESGGFRTGWFFADSDAYKWLEAAARSYLRQPSPALGRLMGDFVALLGRAQQPDGYLYTYNQAHFPASRWENLLIEHELYCHGHLIEAGAAHHQATGEPAGLEIARRAADLLVEVFLHAGPAQTDGHEEIELALLRLYEVTAHGPYLELAAALLERRGRHGFIAPLVYRQNASMEARRRIVNQRLAAYRLAHPGQPIAEIPPGNFAKQPPLMKLRWNLSALSGQYFQMHAPLERQTVPVGHAVRFGYLMSAAARLARLTGERGRLPAMLAAWERMVTRRMVVTGGLGALPGLEGFGRDNELDPETTYAETCAALACLLWNWELALLTGEARYSELFEWQLYNAAAVGMGLNGDAYLYNNPLLCRGGVRRRPWFAVPCCPSNLSRLWAALDEYICSTQAGDVWVHQYIGGETPAGAGRSLHIESALPWLGDVRLALNLPAPAEFTLSLRLPAWAGETTVTLNGAALKLPAAPADRLRPASGGYDPRPARWLPIRRCWSPGDKIEINLTMPIRLRRAAPGVRGHSGRAALTRGPLVYCLESVDNPGVDLFSARLNPASLHSEFVPGLLGGAQALCGETVNGQPLNFIPYFLWANRGESQMTVWVNTGGKKIRQFG